MSYGEFLRTAVDHSSAPNQAIPNARRSSRPTRASRSPQRAEDRTTGAAWRTVVYKDLT